MNKIIIHSGHWFSRNSDRARTEKFQLIYIPVWIWLTVHIIFLDKYFLFRKDAILIPFALIITLPYLIVPALLWRKHNHNNHWYLNYWFKSFLFIMIFQVFCNYFISDFFFDVLGLVYNFPNLKLTFNSSMTGRGAHSVPLFIYLLTITSNLSYHSISTVVIRRIETTNIADNKWIGIILLVLLSALLSYFWAWIETLFFASSIIEKNFLYINRQTMLAYGPIIFGLRLIPSFIIFYFLDEQKKFSWSLLKVCTAALSAAMIALFLIDVVTGIMDIIPLSGY